MLFLQRWKEKSNELRGAARNLLNSRLFSRLIDNYFVNKSTANREKCPLVSELQVLSSNVLLVKWPKQLEYFAINCAYSVSFLNYRQLSGIHTCFSCLSIVSCSWSLPCKMHDTCSLFCPLDPDKYRLMRVNCTDSLRCMRLTNSFNSLRLHGQQEMEYKHQRVLKVSAIKHWTNTLLCFTDGIVCVVVCASLLLCACIYKSFRECCESVCSSPALQDTPATVRVPQFHAWLAVFLLEARLHWHLGDLER